MYITHLLKLLDTLEYGAFSLTTPDGQTHTFKGTHPGPHGQLTLHNSRILPTLMAEGNVGMARTYKEGLWESEDLIALMECAIYNENSIPFRLPQSWIKRCLAQLSYALTRNTKRGSARNIAAHYDLGNPFYDLWLDDSMTYSSGLFTKETDSLETAQMQKYDRLLSGLGSTPKTVLEIGCGWGGFAERLLTTTPHTLTGITLSKAQKSYADERLAPYEDRATLMLKDYRDLTGRYDAIVSIEMFEAVGQEYWSAYFATIAKTLADTGKALIQTITIANEDFDHYRNTSDMIRSYIFPGGLLPSPSRFEEEANRANLRITNSFAFGSSYATTLEHWLNRFDAQVNSIRDLGYDEGFIRLWRFYLAFCIVGFRSGRTDVMQFELTHA